MRVASLPAITAHAALVGLVPFARIHTQRAVIADLPHDGLCVANVHAQSCATNPPQQESLVSRPTQSVAPPNLPS